MLEQAVAEAIERFDLGYAHGRSQIGDQVAGCWVDEAVVARGSHGNGEQALQVPFLASYRRSRAHIGADRALFCTPCLWQAGALGESRLVGETTDSVLAREVLGHDWTPPTRRR